MSHVLSSINRHRRRRALPPALSVVEILVLAPVAAILALWVIPDAFGIEWSCVGRYGVQATRGDSFGDAVTVGGTFGWLAVFVAVLFAHIAERPRLAAVIPLAWFVGLVLTTLIVAATIGPLPCPS